MSTTSSTIAQEGCKNYTLSERTQTILWIASVPISVLCGAAILFCFAAVTSYINNKKKKGSKNSNFLSMSRKASPRAVSVNDLSSRNDMLAATSTLRLSRKSKESGGMRMHYILLAAVFATILRLIVELMLLFYSQVSDKACDALVKIDIAFTAFCLHLCHFQLWMRQHVFFSNPVLKQYRPRFFTHISYLTYPFMVLAVLLVTFLHIWWRDYENNNNKVCQPQENGKVTVYLPYGLQSCCCVFINLLTTFLFVYPIIRHNAKMKACRLNKSNKIVAKQSERRTQRHWQNLKMKAASLTRLVKKAVMSCFVIIVFDSLAAFVVMYLPTNLPTCFISVTFEIDILVNLLFLIYAYPEWQDFFFLCCNNRYYEP